jgi:hypothetical protein
MRGCDIFSVGLRYLETITEKWSECTRIYFLFFRNSSSGGGVHLGPLGTSATNWPIVPAPGDYENGVFGGMTSGRGNRST